MNPVLSALRKAYVRAVRMPRRAVRRWRSSLQLRVISTTLVLGLVTLALLGGYLSNRIQTGLFDQRVTEILQESARSTRQTQITLDSSTAQTSAEIQELFNIIVTTNQVGGSASRSVFLLRAQGQLPAVVVNDMVSDQTLRPLITDELRTATVAAKGGQRWQSVAVPVDDGGTEPGVVVGATVNVAVAGPYELYFLYSLSPEQETLGLIQRMLAIGALTLVALLGAMTWLVTRQAVRPVRLAAGVAERLADGHLVERMEVRGQDEMATLARSFNEMAASLQDQIRRMEGLSALQRRFVSDVSHELRTPLTTIRMASEVLHAGRGDFSPALKRSTELLAAQLDRFEELLADLLEISRFDAGAAILDAEGRDVRDVVSAAIDGVLPLAERRGSFLRVVTPEDAATADIDPRRVERILRNLLVNAIEHADGSTVEVTVAADARAVAVTVRDHGVGMTAEAASHVFDRFWRADPARARTTGGTGLGLSISLEDAHLHGGWLEAWGRPEQGAAFRLTLPRRAGIVLTSSPLPLVPVDPDGPTGTEPGADVVSGTGLGLADPAAIPDLDSMEVR